MNQATFFRLLVRAIGVLLLAQGLPTLAHGLLYLVQTVGPEWESIWQGASRVWYVAALLPQIVAGIYLLFFADGLIRACLRDAMGRCPGCGCDTRGIKGDQCPECGSAVTKA